MKKATINISCRLSCEYRFLFLLGNNLEVALLDCMVNVILSVFQSPELAFLPGTDERPSCSPSSLALDIVKLVWVLFKFKRSVTEYHL